MTSNFKNSKHGSEGIKSKEWAISHKIKENKPYLKYSKSKSCFLDYSIDMGIYQYLEDGDVKSLVLKFIQEHVSYQTVETTKQVFLENVVKHLSILLRQDIVVSNNICFQNGRLDLTTLSLHCYSPDVYCFNYQKSFYNKAELLTTDSKNFLKNLCNNDILSLNCIRIWFRNALLQDITDEYSLYLFGVGSTGKSTFSKLIESLFAQTFVSSSLSEIDSKFNKIRLAKAILFIMGDVNYTGLNNQKASFLKALISGETMTGEAKFKDPTQFTPHISGLIHGNNIWEIKQSGELKTGLDRRFLYIKTGSTPEKVDKNLLSKLLNNVSGIINWVLTLNPDLTSLAGCIKAINEKTNPIENSRIEDFLLKLVFLNENDSIEVSAKIKPQLGSLYEAYLRFLGVNLMHKVEPRLFSTKFEEAAKGLRVPLIRIRSGSGLAFKGISLTSGKKIEPTKNNIITSLENQDPFKTYLEETKSVELQSQQITDTNLIIGDLINFAVTLGIQSNSLNLSKENAANVANGEFINVSPQKDQKGKIFCETGWLNEYLQYLNEQQSGRIEKLSDKEKHELLREISYETISFMSQCVYSGFPYRDPTPREVSLCMQGWSPTQAYFLFGPVRQSSIDKATNQIIYWTSHKPRRDKFTRD